MACQQAWAEARRTWCPLVLKYQEQQRLQEYFRRIAMEIPEPHKNWEEVTKPCKWQKILEEKKRV